MKTFKEYINESRIIDKVYDENISNWKYDEKRVTKSRKIIQELRDLTANCSIKPSRARKAKRFSIGIGKGGFGFVVDVDYETLRSSGIKKGTSLEDYLICDDEAELKKIQDKVKSMNLKVIENHRKELTFYTDKMKEEWEKEYENFNKENEKMIKDLKTYINKQFNANIASDGILDSGNKLFSVRSHSAPSRKQDWYDNAIEASKDNHNISVSGETGTNYEFNNGYGMGSNTQYGIVQFDLDLSNYRGTIPEIKRL